MNERIKELLEQAGFDVKRLLEPYPGGFPREDFLALESFAELIVRECVAICKEKERPNLYGVREVENTIKEHFGVEESQGWVCPKCGTDRTKAACPKGHAAALTGDCPMVGEAQ